MVVCNTGAEDLSNFTSLRQLTGPLRQKGLTVWFTGLSGSGKTAISSSVFIDLSERGIHLEMLDSEVLRKWFNSELGFSKQDRDENVRRLGFAADMLTRNGFVVLVSAISPYRATREEVRRIIGNFLEVHVNAPLHICEQRDPKGLYKRARAGEIRHVSGIDAPYEPPLKPEVRCDTDRESLRGSTDKVVAAVAKFLAMDLTKDL